MEVKNVRWVGIHTQQYDRTVDLFGNVLGMRRHFEEPATVEFETTEGDKVQVMGLVTPTSNSSVATQRVWCRYSRWTIWSKPGSGSCRRGPRSWGPRIATAIGSGSISGRPTVTYTNWPRDCLSKNLAPGRAARRSDTAGRSVGRHPWTLPKPTCSRTPRCWTLWGGLGWVCVSGR
jgi:hypothetical protein